MTKKKYLYHISDTNVPILEIKRQTPTDPAPSEPKVPRLCVCPAVPNCFAARLFTKGPLYVYKTTKPTKGITPKQVWDMLYTGERWLIPPTKLTQIAKIEPEDILRIQAVVSDYHNQTKQPSDYKLRIAQLAIAWNVLEDRFPNKEEKRVSERLLDFIKVKNPEEYIVNRIISS